MSSTFDSNSQPLHLIDSRGRDEAGAALLYCQLFPYLHFHQRNYKDMISELLNSLFLTYLASEYLVAQDDASYGHNSQQGRRRLSLLTSSLKQRLTIVMTGVVLVVNIIDRVVGVTEWIQSGIPFLPLKVFVAAAFYFGGLYVDINRRVIFAKQRASNNDNSNGDDDSRKQPQRMPLSIFLPKVLWAFCKVLPAYPFLAVTISVGWMFVINLWDFLQLPEAWLGPPIYYGTLYGPFAWTYVFVKQQVMCRDAHALPS